MPRIGFEKFIRNKTQTATLFVDLNKVPMHEIDLLVHRIAVFFFVFMPFLVSFLSSPLLFCVFGVLHRLLHNSFKARRALTTGYLFSSVSFPCLRLAFARVSYPPDYVSLGWGSAALRLLHHPFTGHEVNCFLTCASSALGAGAYDS